MFINNMVFQMKEGEKMAGGMSYRTMNGIDTKRIMKYFDGSNEESSVEILQENKNYYVASAEKTIARLNLAKKRLEHAHLDHDLAKSINSKMNTSIKWLEKLKKDIQSVTNKSEILEIAQYKKWHAVKLLPSTAEGLLVTSAIKSKIDDLKNLNCHEFKSEKLENARIHNEKADEIFLKLLQLNEKSDFKAAERSRLEGYNEAVIADKELELLN